MGVMVKSVLWVMQDLYHEPYDEVPGMFGHVVFWGCMIQLWHGGLAIEKP